MNILRKLTLVIVALGSVSVAQADSIAINTYRLDVTIESCEVNYFNTGYDDCTEDHAVSAGNTYSGYFTIDRSVLDTDGYTNAGFESFFFELGGTIWDSENPYPDSDHVGTRCYNPFEDCGPFGPWTLLVEDGNLAGFCCGVRGEGDFPFMDLYSFSNGPFPPDYVNIIAIMEKRPDEEIGPITVPFRAQGSFSIHLIPAPGTLALVGIGLFGMGLSRRRKKQLA